MSNIVLLGPQYIPLHASDNAVGAGNLYIGTADTDPTVTANQITVEALQENGSLVAMQQPITLSAGGIPLYNGSPVSLYVDGDYSLAVTTALGSQIYYVPNNATYTWAAGVNNNLVQFDGALGIEDSGESVATIGVLDTPAEWTGQQNFNATAISSSSNLTAWNLNTAQRASLSLDENTTVSNPTFRKEGADSVLKITQTGSFTLAWDSLFEWGLYSAPTAPAANGDYIVVSFYYDGTKMLGAEFIRVEA